MIVAKIVIDERVLDTALLSLAATLISMSPLAATLGSLWGLLKSL